MQSESERKTGQGSRRAKQERLEARISVEQKQMFQRAAELSGRSLTDFVVGSVQDAALRTIERFESVRLGTRDRDVFVDALLEPARPSEALRRAARRYKDTMDG